MIGGLEEPAIRLAEDPEPSALQLEPPPPDVTRAFHAGDEADLRLTSPGLRLAQVKEELIAWVKTLMSAAVYAVLIVTFLFQIARVEGQSMAPTLEDQDRLIVNKLVYRIGEPRRIDRLQQVVDRVDLERLDGVLIVRGDEDDLRRRVVAEHPPRDLEAGEPRHLDVQEHDVGLQLVDRGQRLDTVAGLADHLDAADLIEQVAQLVAGQLLVVHEHRFQNGLRLER